MRVMGIAAGCLLMTSVAGAQQVQPREALRRAVAGTSTVAVVMDVASGRVEASAGGAAVEAASAPGSTLKPFVLLAALEHGVVRPGTEVACRGTLNVAGRNLACTHPRSLGSFRAESALAYSCNAYFAAVARRMDAGMLEGALGAFGVRVKGVGASADARVLLALGLAGVRVSPVQLAGAYRRMAVELGKGDGPRREALQVVERGMVGSASYGMANNAATEGVKLAAKTGTASEPGQAWTHGWFAGIVFDGAEKPQRVVVIYVPRGSGADAALVAHRYLVAERVK